MCVAPPVDMFMRYDKSGTQAPRYPLLERDVISREHTCTLAFALCTSITLGFDLSSWQLKGTPAHAAGPQAEPDHCENCCASTSTCSIDPGLSDSGDDGTAYTCCAVPTTSRRDLYCLHHLLDPD